MAFGLKLSLSPVCVHIERDGSSPKIRSNHDKQV